MGVVSNDAEFQPEEPEARQVPHIYIQTASALEGLTGLSSAEILGTNETGEILGYMGRYAPVLADIDENRIRLVDNAADYYPFNRLPFDSASIDRLVYPYTVPAQKLSKMSVEELTSFVGETERVLSPGGRAFIFPAVRGYATGNVFEIQDLEKALAIHSWYNGGKLTSTIHTTRLLEVLEITELASLRSEKTAAEIRRISRAAIGDAMVIAYSHDYNGELYEFQHRPLYEAAYPKIDTESDTTAAIDFYTFRTTGLLCVQNCKRVINYLAANYERHFDRLILLNSQANIQKNKNTFRNSGWSTHAYFLARNLSGRWYAGSPANYDVVNYPQHTRNNPLNTFFESDDLGEVLAQIAQADGGVWGSSEFIEGIEYIHPRIRRDARSSNYHAFITTVVKVDGDEQYCIYV